MQLGCVLVKISLGFIGGWLFRYRKSELSHVEGPVSARMLSGIRERVRRNRDCAL